MSESGYYPMGAEFDPSAPWNQGKNKAISRDVVISSSISKSCECYTTKYHVEGDKYEGFDEVLDDVNWYEEYSEEHYTPIQLIEMYKKELEEKKKTLSNPYQISQIEKIIAECEGWVEDEIEVFEDKL